MWRWCTYHTSVHFSILMLLSSLDAVCSCGQTISGRRGEIETPNYPDNYDNRLNCTWTIEVGEHDTITMRFVGFDVETSSSRGCPDHFRIYDGPNTSCVVLLDICGTDNPNLIISSGSTLTVTFITNERNTETGVRLVWSVSDTFTINLNPATWSEANAACMKEGGHLAVHNGLTEISLTKMLSNFSGSVWSGDYFTPWVWLKGCYKDKDRHLTSVKHYSDSKENQVKVCQYKCEDSVYFGLQDRKCFCLTTEDLDELDFSKPEKECNMPCPGNSNEKCGGDSGLTVYMNDICWRNSSTWTGKISRTVSGRTCQSWKSDFPHTHPLYRDHMFPDGSNDEASNYCRDPDGKGAPWCYTTDAEVPWQFCDVPPCAGTCWTDPVQYSGNLNVSVSGYKCLPWAADYLGYNNTSYDDATKYPDITVNDASNYCRSQSGYPALWCFVNEGIHEEEFHGRRFDYCGSPPCFENVISEDTGELCRVYGANGSKFFYQEQSCSQKELYACFINASGHESFISNVETDFYEPRTMCKKFYISDYKLLFGLMYNHDIENIHSKYWLGNFRATDNSRNKDIIPTPSACKTIRLQENALQTEHQPNCELEHGFVCQTEAILCGENFSTDNGTISWPGYQKQYENNKYCVWEIHVEEGRSINVVFLNIDVEDSKDCSFDSIEISDTSTDGAKTLDILCGKASNVRISSSSNKVMIKFKSDKETGGRGFHLEWISESIPTPSPNSGRVTKTSTDTDASTIYPLEGGTIAGIVVGGLFIIVVAIVLAVLLRRRMMVTHKQEATELQPGIHYNKEGSLSYTNQKDVYSTPLPNELRKLKNPSSKEKFSPEPDTNYYHHLHQASSAGTNQPVSSNLYGKLQTQDTYDHTTDTASDIIGDTYSHLDDKKANLLNAENDTYDHTTDSTFGIIGDTYSHLADRKANLLNIENDTYDHTTDSTSEIIGDTYSHLDDKKTVW